MFWLSSDLGPKAAELQYCVGQVAYTAPDVETPNFFIFPTLTRTPPPSKLYPVPYMPPDPLCLVSLCAFVYFLWLYCMALHLFHYSIVKNIVNGEIC